MSSFTAYQVESEAPDEHGFVWIYSQRDFARWLCICGQRDLPPDDGRYQVRYGVIFKVGFVLEPPDGVIRPLTTATQYPDMVDRAKSLIRARIAQGRGIYGDNCVEGNEEEIL